MKVSSLTLFVKREVRAHCGKACGVLRTEFLRSVGMEPSCASLYLMKDSANTDITRKGY